VGSDVETRVDSALDAANLGLSVRMLGPLTIIQGGVPIELPASRKARALFAYLALSPGAVGRSRLCDLLWDAPNDPRGELRWCLSKLRNILDEPHRSRVRTSDDRVALDLSGCPVDAIEVASATETGLKSIDLGRLRSLSGLFISDFLEGLDIDRSPNFSTWLMAQRRRFSACHAAILEQLAVRLPAGCNEASSYLEKWIEIAPFDRRAHSMLLNALALQGKIGECEEHLAATGRLFESEGLDFAPIRAAWRSVKEGRPAPKRYAEPVPRQLIQAPPDPADITPNTTNRASLAVMPFVETASGESLRGGLADGLTHDIITRLAKLRDLFVIARGSVFALAERGVGPDDAGRRLNVDYVASGTVRRSEGHVTVRVELVEVRTARIVWAEAFHRKLDDTFDVLDQIGDSIVSSISTEIEMVERNRAILKAPNSLNAWEAYHRGLWHMYRFTQSENERAQHYFARAVSLDPTFARAYAGLSFTHWQSAFQRWADRETESDRAFETAGQSLLVDDHNPAAHWAMGRALWLRGRQDESLRELEKAVELSPNFALGHYALSFVHSQSGDPGVAIRSSDHSRNLSPFDPLLFGMLGARAMALVRLGQFEEAADWALKAAARPNAHQIILAIAAHCLALAGRLDEGRAFAASIRKALPQYSTEDFLAAFRFAPDTAALFRQGGKRIGLTSLKR
jgi:DNA-binding SARP family transcriptional activator/TolB-like protein/Flp pilus assembly protein TadD